MLDRILTFAFIFTAGSTLADPLPSWTETETKAQIIGFVSDVTDPGSDGYVTPGDRIAVFDNDGTLWAEQPIYFQLIFAIDRVRARAAADPSILTSDALRAAAEGDMEAIAASGHDGLKDILRESHSGLSVSDFIAEVRLWLDTARHPKTGLPYNEMTYQPMIELLRYLRDEGFKTYIVSGGGIHFMRAFAEAAYGIPPEQVIGSAGQTSYSVIDGVPTLTKDPAIAFVDDKAGKPVGIDSKLGKRPIIAGGNSDGDFEMLEWSTAGDGPRLGLIVHHTDGEREWAYDRGSSVGGLERGLDEADDRGWLLIDMAQDWSRIYTGAN